MEPNYELFSALFFYWWYKFADCKRTLKKNFNLWLSVDLSEESLTIVKAR